VINCRDGRRIGYVTDLEFCPKTGQIQKFIVPQQSKLFGGICGKVENISFCDVVQIGPDVILVNVCEPKKK
jgi:YlmC/YmxH family sporulation protein